MFDTMKVIKISAGLLGSFLFLLLALWGASALYHVGPDEHHGEGEHAQAYTIEVADAGGSDKAEEQVDFSEVMASADAAKGEKVFGKCRACHKLDGNDAVGPHLNGVVGRQVASAPGFAYSDGMVAHREDAPEWTPEALQLFLENPKGVVSGTKMSFGGLKKIEDRANLIAYLEQNS